MSGASLQTTPAPVTAAELLELGFTPKQISQLSDMRESWNPIAEQARSLLEWRRMQFTKWLYERGYYNED